jgi:hypothetical protein
MIFSFSLRDLPVFVGRSERRARNWLACGQTDGPTTYQYGIEMPKFAVVANKDWQRRYRCVTAVSLNLRALAELFFV